MRVINDERYRGRWLRLNGERSPLYDFQKKFELEETPDVKSISEQ